MESDLAAAYSISNLRKAWRRLLTNTEVRYKKLFRNIYRSYQLSINENLNNLHQRLINSTYQPSHSTKLYIPKKSGIQRLYSLLCVEDQIVYQALLNIIAERLYPKVKKEYNKTVYGNLYAGRRSIFFYKDWRTTYTQFGKAVQNAVKGGFVYAASFDLTACYDSIDHQVLGHFLSELGLQREFVDSLLEYLKRWSINLSEDAITIGHGIPQGPVSSGLLAEVVLSFFDEKRPKNHKEWSYLRYVDDIRFYAKNEKTLRKILIEMDLLSKRIGLFPQSSKIQIHKVANISEEIKSIHYPPEYELRKKVPDQKKLYERIVKLSPACKVTNETRFKFVLNYLEPSSKLSSRLLCILENQPHLYENIFEYFSKYDRIPKKLSVDLVNLLINENLYASFTASGINMIRGKYHLDAETLLQNFCLQILSHDKYIDPELIVAATSILLTTGKLMYKDIVKYVNWSHDWWPRTEIIRYVNVQQIGDPSFDYLVNQLLTDQLADVALAATEIIIDKGISTSAPITKMQLIAQLTLAKANRISEIKAPCPISGAMRRMIGTELSNIDWKLLLGKHYRHLIPKIMRFEAAIHADPTAWINLMDTLHDDLLHNLYLHDKSLGSYTHGKMGSNLAAASRLAKKYPKFFRAVKEVHQLRLGSPYSHSVKTSKRIGKLRTQFITFSKIGEILPKLRRAYIELSSKW
ncbi:MAG: RNA-directed DNA polymerase [Anaerolineae bacterium]